MFFPAYEVIWFILKSLTDFSPVGSHDKEGRVWRLENLATLLGLNAKEHSHCCTPGPALFSQGDDISPSMAHSTLTWRTVPPCSRWNPIPQHDRCLPSEFAQCLLLDLPSFLFPLFFLHTISTESGMKFVWTWTIYVTSPHVVEIAISKEQCTIT